jgi:hypothetical protein
MADFISTLAPPKTPTNRPALEIKPEHERAMVAAGYGSKKTVSQGKELLRDVLQRIVEDAILTFSGHRARAAARLGISERTLYRWLAEPEKWQWTIRLEPRKSEPPVFVTDVAADVSVEEENNDPLFL